MNQQPKAAVAVWRHTADESPGTLAPVFEAAGLRLELCELWQELPDQFVPGDWAGLVVLGGPMGVYESAQYPFLSREVVWLRQAVAAGLPTLGICLGAQLLAHALGAEVRIHHGVRPGGEHGPLAEIGWYEVQLTPAAAADPLLSGLESPQTVFQWHGDTFDLPVDAVRLAEAATCREQAFRYGPCAWGLQFHPEVTTEIIEHWLSEPAGCAELAQRPYIDVPRIHSDLPRRLGPMQASAQQVFQRFAALCRARGAAHLGQTNEEAKG